MTPHGASVTKLFGKSLQLQTLNSDLWGLFCSYVLSQASAWFNYREQMISVLVFTARLHSGNIVRRYKTFKAIFREQESFLFAS